MQARRDKLKTLALRDERNNVLLSSPHAGLWFDKYLVSQKDKANENNQTSAADKQSRGLLVKDAASIAAPVAYKNYYKLLETSLNDLKEAGHAIETRVFESAGRIALGAGGESVLETAVTLHRTYGVPYLPGSALKGLTSAFARKHLEDDEWRRGGDYHRVVFGDTDESGFVTFYDALPVVTDNRILCKLEPDVLTVHHRRYYNATQPEPPADWDDPNPVPFLSFTGTFLVALAMPNTTDTVQAQSWLKLAFDVLTNALQHEGIGAKTSSGYGRLKIKSISLT